MMRAIRIMAAAGADVMSPGAAIIIGLIAGVIIPFSVVFFDRRKIDDPVGATSVHLACGVWGTLAVGIFGSKAGWGQLWVQLYGVAAVGAFAFTTAFGLMYLLKKTVGIRVPREYEERGLDISEHEMHAYETSREQSDYHLSIK